MAWYLGQSWLFLALAFLLGLLVGWLIWGRSARFTATAPSRSEAGTTTKAEAVATLPVAEAPVAAAPAARAPAAEAPAAEAPVIEIPAVETPIVEAPAVEAPAVEAPVVDAPAVEPVAAEAVVEPRAPEARPKAVAEPKVVAEPEPDAVAEPEVAVAAEPVAAEPVTAEPFTAEPVTAEPVAVPTPRPDNLQRIEGIGPKIASTLAAAGIVTFTQLAACDQPTLVEALRRGGVRFAPSLSTWTHQAELLAQGDEAGFTQLTSRLTAGRRAR